MATYIKTIKDKDGNVILPRTRAEAVTTTGGSTMDSELNDLVARIGNNSELETDEKAKIILAVNEVYNKTVDIEKDLSSHIAESAKWFEEI